VGEKVWEGVGETESDPICDGVDACECVTLGENDCERVPEMLCVSELETAIVLLLVGLSACVPVAVDIWDALGEKLTVADWLGDSDRDDEKEIDAESDVVIERVWLFVMICVVDFVCVWLGLPEATWERVCVGVDDCVGVNVPVWLAEETCVRDWL
jgi:hypothetical protein